MPFIFLYKITNKINNKVYIGQTVDPKRRWYEHRRMAANPKQVISFAIKKYGNENFSFEIIVMCRELDDANYIEEALITQYECHISFGHGYNVEFGGSNKTMIEATKQKISNTKKGCIGPNLGKKFSEEHKQKLAQAKLGKERKEFTEETKRKMAKSKKGNTAWLGKKHSPETIQKLKTKVFTEEHRRKISDAKKLRDSAKKLYA